MAIKSAMNGNEKKHFSCKWHSNQERMETKKKTFVPDVDQIRKEWRREKKLLSLNSIKSGKNGNEKKNFSASCQSNHERMETEKTENEARGSQMSNKMRLRMLEM